MRYADRLTVVTVSGERYDTELGRMVGDSEEVVIPCHLGPISVRSLNRMSDKLAEATHTVHVQRELPVGQEVFVNGRRFKVLKKVNHGLQGFVLYVSEVYPDG